MQALKNLFKKKRKPVQLPAYSKTVDYRGLEVLFTVSAIGGEFDRVRAYVYCEKINKSRYTECGVSADKINSSFDRLFLDLKYFIDNYLDYDKNMKDAIAQIKQHNYATSNEK